MRGDIQGTEKVAAEVGRWSPSDIAYIERIDFSSQLGAPASIEMQALLQRTDQAGWPDPTGEFVRVRLRFSGVGNLSLQRFGGGAVQVMGFDIRFVGDRGLEDIRYQIEDYENGVVEFTCREVEVVDAERTQEFT